MIPKGSNISEAIFQEAAAECFLQYERYRLKTNVIGINLQKDFLNPCYDTLQTRMTERFSLLYEKLRQGLAGLYKNFTIAQASSLRILNNIMRDYRRRVGILSNEPLSSFKYNRFDRSEKMLLESLLYNQKDSYDQILKFQQELTIATEQGNKEIQQRYQQNKDIRQDYRKVLEVIDKTQCFSYKYYENFQRSMQTTISNLESYFDKLNAYLTVWENIGSTKAYEVKSAKQIELEVKTSDYDSNKRFMQQQTQEQLEALLNSCPPNSIQRQEYRRKLNELRHYNMERERKLEMVGRMFNKRKNRAGILVNKRRDVTLLDWYFDTEGNRIKFAFQDEFRNYNSDSENSEFRLTEYEMQKPLKRQKIQQMKHNFKQQQNQSYSRNQWLYDKYGKENDFDLILCISQQIQMRVEFEMNKQYELQCTDDRRKRELFERQNYQARDAERRQSLHIGYLHPYEKTEMELLQQRSYHTEYLPEIVTGLDSSIEFSDEQQLEEQIQPESINSQEIHKSEILQSSGNNLTENSQAKPIYSPLVQMVNAQREPSNEEREAAKGEQVRQEQKEEEVPFSEACLAEQIIRSYFREYSSKVVRKQDQPFYKKSKFLYFSDWSAVPWQTLVSYFEHEKIFVYTSSGIAYLKRVFSIQKEKIKCIVYTLEDIQEDLLRRKITECFASLALITVKFVSIYPDLEKDQLQSFMIGLLLTLLKYGEMPQDYQDKDYIQTGRQILEDFNYYFYPESCKSSKTQYMKKFKPVRPKEVFEPSKLKQPEDTDSKRLTTSSTKAGTQRTTLLLVQSSTNGSVNFQSSQPRLEKKREMLDRQKEQLKKDLMTVKCEEKQHPSQFLHLKLEQQTGSMRRSDSRQNLNNYDMQVSLIGREGGQQQVNNSEDDYENI